MTRAGFEEFKWERYPDPEVAKRFADFKAIFNATKKAIAEVKLSDMTEAAKARAIDKIQTRGRLASWEWSKAHTLTMDGLRYQACNRAIAKLSVKLNVLRIEDEEDK